MLRAVDDGDAVAADDLQRAVGVEEGGGVLVDADAEQTRVGGDEGQEATDPVALAEVLVDDQSGTRPNPATICAIRCAGRRAAGAEGDHVRGEDRGAGAGAGDDRARCVALRTSSAPGCRRRCVARRIWLPPVRKMPVASSEQLERRVAVGVARGRRCRATSALLGAQPEEERLVALAGGLDRGGGRDDGDPGVAAAGELDEGRRG